jgi:hypothetical protein
VLLHVLHVGDHDPDGVGLYERLAEDAVAMCADQGEPNALTFERVAVTLDQVQRLSLPGAPAKGGNGRSRGWAELTYQAETLSPAQLAADLRLEHLFDTLAVSDGIIPIAPRPGRCAAVVRSPMGSFDGNCAEPPTVTGWWLFEYPRRHLTMVQLCAAHALALADNPRLTLG